MFYELPQHIREMISIATPHQYDYILAMCPQLEEEDNFWKLLTLIHSQRKYFAKTQQELYWFWLWNYMPEQTDILIVCQRLMKDKYESIIKKVKTRLKFIKYIYAKEELERITERYMALLREVKLIFDVGVYAVNHQEYDGVDMAIAMLTEIDAKISVGLANV